MHNKYIVKQNDIKDCGICCLESIIKYYNGYIPMETLRLDTKTNNNGTTAYNIIKTAKKYGFNAFGQKIENINNKNIILPAIAHIITEKGLKHFIVIYKITKNNVIVMDPSKGYKKIKKEDFIKQWTNIILILKPYKRIPLYKIKNNLFLLFLEISKKEYKLITKVLIINIIITFLSILLSYYLKITISSIETSYINSIIFITIIFFILNILKIFYTYIKNDLSIYLNKNINLKIIPDFLNYIINLPLDVIKSRTTGEILTRIEELNNIKNLFSEILITILLDIFLIITSSIFLYNISKELFFILCIISLLLIIVGIISCPILNNKINDNIELETEFNAKLSESIDTLESIKNLNITKREEEILEKSFVEYEDNSFKFSKFLNNLNSLNNTIYDIGIFIILSYGLFLIMKNSFSLILLITFNSLISYLIEPLKEIISLIPKYYHIKLSFIKISEFLNIEKEELSNNNGFSNGDIRYNSISYSYDNNKILNNISFSIKMNNHLTISGKTGSGKSTLFKMLNHNIKDYEGNIYIGDINIKDYSLNTLRSNILYVSQKEKLFNDTILNNIVLSKKISIKELNKVLKITKVDEIIEKKSLRLNSYLYDNGSNLSGGERQRIILARSIIYNPKILILDESLSEVDKDTEKEIINNIDKYLPNTTIIYISHNNTSYFKNKIEMDKLI
ncbi:MAG: peptidase domain-containing ABC transporter [Candidatus Coprovivens sp.]